MKLSQTLALVFSSSLLALTACGTSTIGGGSGGGGYGGDTNTGAGSTGGLCNGVPSPVSCTDTSCPDGYTCVDDPDPTTCHSSHCTCEAQGWACTADCGKGGRSCVKGDPVDCSNFPTFNKTCTVDADCVTKLHQVNCCGTRTAIGINKTAAPAFDAAEVMCASTYPKCGCPQQPATAEDGNTMPDFSDNIPVACRAGQCMTYVPDAPLCNGQLSAESCTKTGCPDGWTCTPDPDPTTCHSSMCTCSASGWGCTDDCQQNGSTCVKGL